MEINVAQNILNENEHLALENQKLFQAKKVFVINLLGSPGSGKTTLVEKILTYFAGRYRIGVIEGDLFTTKDADRIEKLTKDVVQINTSGGCHLDANMVRKTLQSFDLEKIDLLIIENVGNLVCPAEFYLGEDVKVVLLSTPEGDDKPLKYPLIFKEAATVIISKIDLLTATNFSLENAVNDIKTLNPQVPIFPLCVTKDEGMEKLYTWLEERLQTKKC